MVKRKVAKRKVGYSRHKKSTRPTQNFAIGMLLLNIFILPGLGSLMAGKTKDGVWQVILVVVSIPLFFIYLIGLPVFLGAWIWGIATGMKVIKEAK